VQSLLIIKTGALGDVLRTTSILPGLAKREPQLRVTWLTAPAARELVENHPLVSEVLTVNPNDAAEVSLVTETLSKTRWDRIFSFDDEEPLCELASALECKQLSGAFISGEGARTYSEDVEPWFGMGLLSKFGKKRADQLKIANEESHASIFARMLGIEAGETELPLLAEATSFGEAFAAKHELAGKLVVGLNTGAGGRWVSKQLSVEKSVQFATEVAERATRGSTFVVLGGPAEDERNSSLLASLREAGLTAVDGGTQNTIGQFAAIVSELSLLLTSDSLALHIGVARKIAVVAFFAPTSAAEIELYGRGVKVQSMAADYCTYRSDVDTSTITARRLVDAAQQFLGN